MNASEVILRTTDHNGFPVVVSMQSQYLVGFVNRRDISIALGMYAIRVNSYASHLIYAL